MKKLPKLKESVVFLHLVRYFPRLPERLIMANVGISPAHYLEKSFVHATLSSLFGAVILSLLMIDIGKPLLLVIPLALAIFIVAFYFNVLKIESIIAKRKKEIDKDAAFVGRYMLLKLYSGEPLLNALIEQSKGSSIISRYIKEIVDDVNSGSTIEASLDKAMKYSPSDKFRKILFYISNALKYGVDVTGPLESAINQIIDEQMIEIQRYGKKMNSFMIFYMLLGVVLPSLGITIMIIVAGFLGVSIKRDALLIINFFLLLLQLIFLLLIKTRIPSIDL